MSQTPRVGDTTCKEEASKTTGHALKVTSGQAKEKTISQGHTDCSPNSHNSMTDVNSQKKYAAEIGPKFPLLAQKIERIGDLTQNVTFDFGATHFHCPPRCTLVHQKPTSGSVITFTRRGLHPQRSMDDEAKGRPCCNRPNSFY